MGTSLVPIGNHAIVFKNRTYEQIKRDIMQRLSSLQFVNREFLNDYESEIFNTSDNNAWSLQPEDEFYSLAEDGYVSINFNDQLLFSISEYTIRHFLPVDRYHDWMIKTNCFDQPDILYRNEWRKYLFQIQHAMGGDRVIYMADNAHKLDGYSYLECPFADIEAEMEHDLGKPANSCEEAFHNQSYFIDHLNNILWDIQFYFESSHFLIIDFITQCLLTPAFNQHFRHLFNHLFENYPVRPLPDIGFASELTQIEYLSNHFRNLPSVAFVAYQKPLITILSLKNEHCSLSIFYLPDNKIFTVIENKIIVAETNFPHSIFSLFVLADDIQHYLYNYKGEYLNISAPKIEFINKPSSYYPLLKFVIATQQNQTHTIYNSTLQQLITNVNHYTVYVNDYCIAQTPQGQTLLHTSSTIPINQMFASTEYFQHPNYLNNQLHFFILKNFNNQYALFQLRESTLFNPFDWDDYKANGNFNYLFFLKDNQWHQINYLSFKISKTNNPSFPTK